MAERQLKKKKHILPSCAALQILVLLFLIHEQESQHLLCSYCKPSSIGGKKLRRKRKRGRKKPRRGEKKEEEKERRQTETDGQKDKCGKTDGKRELKRRRRRDRGID